MDVLLYSLVVLRGKDQVSLVLHETVRPMSWDDRVYTTVPLPARDGLNRDEEVKRRLCSVRDPYTSLSLQPPPPPFFSSSLTTTLLHFFIPTKTMYVPSRPIPSHPSLTTVSRTTSTQQKGTEQASGREMGDHAASVAGDTVSLSLRRRRGEDTSQLELTSI